ncbi:MAG: alkyl hydroperoxide reductase subunit C [candidate division Zixibacteria bacterium]
MVKINEHVPDFSVDAYYKGDMTKVSLSDYMGKWVILFFYPADFTFVCPTELGDLADNYEKFVEEDAEILVASTDTVFSHKAWHDNSATVGKITFPMLADPTGKLSRDFGVYLENDGLALRGTFVIDPDGFLKAYEIHDNSIGRSTDELLRKLQAAKFVREHGGEVCPINWKPGEKTLKPGMDLVGKI